MLELPNLNDENARALLQQALNRLKTLCPDDWANARPHDPGVTILDLLVWLKSEQQAAIDPVGKNSLRKLLSLLGLKPLRARPAAATVCLQADADAFLPHGTRFSALGLTYETESPLFVLANRILATGTRSAAGCAFTDYGSEAASRRIAVFGVPGETRGAFYIAFARALPRGKAIRLYFEFAETQPPRNTVEDARAFTPLAQLAWEYYDGKLRSWRPVSLQCDETLGLLFSGQLVFSLPGSHAPDPETQRFCLRVRLLQDGYDRLPVCTKLRLNSVRVLQQTTHCELLSFSRRDVLEEKLSFDSWLAPKSAGALFIHSGDGYIRSEPAALEPTPDGLFRLNAADRPPLDETDGAPALLLCLYDKPYYPRRVLGSGDGTAEKALPLPRLEAEDLPVFASLRLLVEGKCAAGKRWQLWQQAASLDDAAPADRRYLFEPERAAIRFGNNLHGKVPSRGQDNLWIGALQTTRGSEGNIGAGRIRDFVRPPGCGLRVEQCTAASGGRGEESLDEMLARAAAAPAVFHRRAVTKEDYAHFAARAPGLVVDAVHIVPLYRPGLTDAWEQTEENAVTVVAEARELQQRAADTAPFLKNLRRQMQEVRLLTTQIHVMLPRYLPLDLYAEITGRQASETAVRAAIERCLRQMKDVLLCESELCRALESLEGVESVRSLTLLTAPTTTRTDAFGDIQIPPHMRLYLRDLHLRQSGG